MSATTRKPAPAAERPSLILALAAYLDQCWRVSDAINDASLKAPPEMTDHGRYAGMVLDRRAKEMHRRKEAVEDAMASIVAETVPEALAQLHLAFALFDVLDGSIVDEDVKHEDGRKINFLFRSALRVLSREHGVSIDDLCMSDYADSEGVTLAELVEPVDEPRKGAT